MFVLNDGVQIQFAHQKEILSTLKEHIDPPPTSLVEAFAHAGIGTSTSDKNIDTFWFDDIRDQWKALLEPVLHAVAPFVTPYTRLTIFGQGQKAYKYDFADQQVKLIAWEPSETGWFRYGLQMEDKQAQLFCYERSLEKNPNYVPSLHYKARCLQAQWKLELALASAQQAVEHSDEYYHERLDLFMLLGELHTQLHKHQAQPGALVFAQEIYKQCIEHDPEQLEARYALASVYALLGHYETALSTLRPAIQKDHTLRRRAERDLDLQDVRKLPAFQVLLDQIAPDFKALYTELGTPIQTQLGSKVCRLEEIGQISVSEHIVVSDLAFVQEATTLEWQGAKGRYTALLAVTQHTYSSTSSEVTQSSEEDRCVVSLLLLPSKGGQHAPTHVERWEPILDEETGLQQKWAIDTGALALLTAPSLAKLVDSPKRHQRIYGMFEENEEDGEYKFAGGKVLTCRVQPAHHQAWWGCLATGEKHCLVIDFGIL